MATPKKNKKGGLKESEIQRMILEYLAERGDVWAWRSQSTGIFDPMSGTWRKLKGVGRINGVADIIGIIGTPGIGPGRFLAIEVKSRYGKPTEEQNSFLTEINSRGGLAFVAKNVEDVILELTKITH